MDEKCPAFAELFFIAMDILSKSWNRMETYVVEAYELLQKSIAGQNTLENGGNIGLLATEISYL